MSNLERPQKTINQLIDQVAQGSYTIEEQERILRQAQYGDDGGYKETVVRAGVAAGIAVTLAASTGMKPAHAAEHSAASSFKQPTADLFVSAPTSAPELSLGQPLLASLKTDVGTAQPNRKLSLFETPVTKPSVRKDVTSSPLALKKIETNTQSHTSLFAPTPNSGQRFFDKQTVPTPEKDPQALPDTVPAGWRNLIDKTAPLYPKVERRNVVTSLYVENRGIPPLEKRAYKKSPVGAQGPGQMMPETWARIGTDGDGDGVKDPNNPYDAVHAMFKHHEGSAGLPIAENYERYDINQSPEVNFEKIIFKRDGKNQLSFQAKYNGSGAPNGKKLSEFPTKGRAKENSDYVKMAAVLMGTNFEYAYQPNTNGPGGTIKKIANSSSASTQPTTPEKKDTTSQKSTLPLQIGKEAVKQTTTQDLFSATSNAVPTRTVSSTAWSNEFSLSVRDTAPGKAFDIGASSAANTPSKKDSASKAKTPRVVDLGEHEIIESGGKKAKVPLAAIPKLESSGQESKPGDKYYVEGANGLAISQKEIAQKWAKVVQRGEADGIDLRAVSSYRTHQHQKDLYARNSNPNEVGRPENGGGHQAGRKIDFVLDGHPIKASYYGTKNGGKASATNPRVAPQSPTWQWLDKHKEELGIEQFWNEPWDWRFKDSSPQQGDMSTAEPSEDQNKEPTATNGNIQQLF